MPCDTSRCVARQAWEELAVLDPHWAILSDPSKRYGRWDLDEFMDTGTQSIGRILSHGPESRERALDFGCGVGRLTYALAPHFSECVGVDISAEMVRQAQQDAPENCRFTTGSLEQFEPRSFDLVVSLMVLQHIPSTAERVRCLTQLARLVASRGLLAFQVPGSIAWRDRFQVGARLYQLLRRLGVPARRLYGAGLHPMRMGAISAERAARLLADAGCELGGLDGGIYYAIRR
jgi:trans-aconitate methyltransferase